jgi:hypothetical protein
MAASREPTCTSSSRTFMPPDLTDAAGRPHAGRRRPGGEAAAVPSIPVRKAAYNGMREPTK